MGHEPHRWKEPNALPSSLIVKFRDGFHKDHPDIRSALNQHRADYDREIGDISHRLAVPRDNSEEIARHLLACGLVDYAYPDHLAHQAMIPNDTFYSTIEYTTLIDMPLAWNNSIGDPSTLIADLGSGIDTTITDIAGNVFPGRNVFNNNNNTTDTVGHGTATAQVMSNSTNNNAGTAGTGWNCMVQPIKITNSGSAAESDMTSGLAWVRNNSTAKIANISYAGVGSAGAAFVTEVQACWDAGIIITASSGDTNDQTSKFPANTLGNTPPCQIIAVAGCGGNNLNNEFADTYGTWCTVIAPAKAWIMQAGGTAHAIFGTSFASPIVAGLIGLMRTIDPTLTPTKILSIITNPQNCFSAGTGYGSPPHPAIVINGYKVTDAARGPRVANISVGGF